MSHFAVLVVGPDVEEQLDPYNENIRVAPYREDIDDEDWQRYRDYCDKQTLAGQTPLTPQEWWDESTVIDGDERYYYTQYNPDSKWDWWVIGGRWAGELILKPGAKGEYGETGTMADCSNDDDGVHVSSARKGDIDWEAMGRAVLTDLGAQYDEVVKMDQDRVPQWCAIEPGETREQYIQRHFKPWHLYAFMRKGRWYEQGKMGWFGVSTNDKPDWPSQFAELLREVDDDEIITVVDCHI